MKYTANIQHVLILAFGVFLGILLCSLLFQNDIEEKTKETRETVTETVYNYIDTTIYHYKIVPRYVDISPDPEKYDSVRTYTGKDNFIHGYYDWEIKTGGFLNSFKFNPVMAIPQTTTVTTATKETVMMIYPKGIYLGGSMGTDINFGVNASYVNKDMIVGYGYKPGTGVHEARAEINLKTIFGR